MLTNKAYQPMDAQERDGDGAGGAGEAPSAVADVRYRAEHILQQMAKIRSMKSAAEHPLYQQQVEAFAAMVHKFRTLP
jgi:hypothetical protein